MSSRRPALDDLRDWMRDLLRIPSKEFTQFEAALSLLPVLPPDEAVTLLRGRALHLYRHGLADGRPARRTGRSRTSSDR